MPNCDVFEVELRATDAPDRRLTYHFWTDLPAGTVLILDCTRSYTDTLGRERHWLLHNERLTVSPSAHGDFNGASGEILVDEADQRALERFEEELNHLSTGMLTPPTDLVRLEFCVGGRQRLRAFGRLNENLTGSLVDRLGDIRVVRVTEAIHFPLDSRYSPLGRES